ncbi:ketopantoate reductase family protein [Amphritea balenae]|uniref:2-dehydropantoate 2-reductase n=1 Tax=Amphritea balenae TaxID=452629 RepID=A0A3P1SQ33_9GAMM|nr:2-dehydropantoate 2-reductase [Amphritea balenae]RRC98252.1 2-dehydropantoate 2-reductase [Amphritea balenae]GGK80412.1 putative 2-dehydropantoate 2-reductase [Amphritea balenae]
MHWHILGAGAIGLLWADKLIRSGHQVTLILRNQDKLDQYSGEFSITDDGQETRHKVDAQLASEAEPVSNLLITTKSFASTAAFNSVKSRTSDSTRVLLLHNGMGPQQQLVEENPTLEVWAGSTTDGAYFSAPFILIRAGKGETRIGRLSQQGSEQLFNELNCDQNPLLLETDIISVLWRKLAINCAINPLTALFNCRNGELLKYDDRRAAMAQICKEVEQVASALNITLFDCKLMEQAWNIAELTGQNHSSMQQDVSQGRPTEIETITGYLCQEAERMGINVPANQMTLDAIRSISL